MSLCEKKIIPLWLWTSYIYLQYVIIISQSHVLYDLTISCPKQEQEETEVESKMCSGKIIDTEDLRGLAGKFILTKRTLVLLNSVIVSGSQFWAWPCTLYHSWRLQQEPPFCITTFPSGSFSEFWQLTKYLRALASLALKLLVFLSSLCSVSWNNSKMYFQLHWHLPLAMNYLEEPSLITSVCKFLPKPCKLYPESDQFKKSFPGDTEHKAQNTTDFAQWLLFGCLTSGILEKKNLFQVQMCY